VSTLVFATRRKRLFEQKAGFVAISFTKRGCLGIVENMTSYGNSDEKDEIGPFYPDLLEDGLRPIDISEEDEGIDEAFGKKKKGNGWHSFKTP
jgi:hypothetical protein